MSVNEFTTGELVEFKGSKKGIIVNIKRKATFDEIKNSIIDKLESAIGFFNGAEICSINCEYLSDVQIMMLKDDISSFNIIICTSLKYSQFIEQISAPLKNPIADSNLSIMLFFISSKVAFLLMFTIIPFLLPLNSTNSPVVNSFTDITTSRMIYHFIYSLKNL